MTEIEALNAIAEHLREIVFVLTLIMIFVAGIFLMMPNGK